MVVLFNRKILRQNRNRVAQKFSEANFLHQEIAEIILETINDCRKNFDAVLEIGARSASLLDAGFVVKTDCSQKMILANNHNLKLVMDDELVCFKEQSFDLIISNLNLHLVNDLPKNLIEIKKLLKPGGMFIASFFGEQNLKELRDVFYQTEQEFYGGITPRIIPNIDVKSAGMLLQKAGFADAVAEKHSFEIEYSDPKKLLYDLKNMGEANVLEERARKFITKKFLFDLTNSYKKLYCRQQNQAIATFEIIILSGWKKS